MDPSPRFIYPAAPGCQKRESNNNAHPVSSRMLVGQPTYPWAPEVGDPTGEQCRSVSDRGAGSAPHDVHAQAAHGPEEAQRHAVQDVELHVPREAAGARGRRPGGADGLARSRGR